MTDPKTLGKYEIQSVLGKGAMGVVYKGFDPHIERSVAIKTVRKDLVDPDLVVQFMGRFKNEARAAGRLHHPNIVGVYEYGEDETVAYIAMEYVEGTGLREYLNRRAQFEVSQLVPIVSQLLLALALAHSRGVVHRDIKPANLIITPDGTLKVADFGIARIDTSTLTQTGMVMGTPSYMSPEQCQGREIDHRSDLFSAGVVLYELLTGERPFGGSVEMIAYKICNEEPRPPSQVSLRPLPPRIDGLVMKALAKAPEARFQSAHAFHQALHDAVGDLAPTGAGRDATVLNLPRVEIDVAAPAAWDDTTLNTVERQLARFVGPMAKVLVRKAATQAHDVAELVSILATNIGDRVQRQRFVDESGANDANVSRQRTGTGGAAQTGSGTPLKVDAARSTGTRGTMGQPARTDATGALAPVPLDPEFVHETTLRLAVYLGPIAKVVARRAAEKASTQDEFVQLVADNIGTQDRNAFLREMGFAG
ncbi:MAG: serine/threonine protein kinase [Aromatoleum sp.]|nr:serine/threonine protein kinase [Aromatoleum sp.]